MGPSRVCHGLEGALVTVLRDGIKCKPTKFSEITVGAIAVFWEGEAELQIFLIPGYME